MNKKFYYGTTATAAIATLLSLAACSQMKKSSQVDFSQAQASQLVAEAQKLRAEGKVSEADAKAKEAGDHYARLGELLLMPEGAQYADEMFLKALELDPSNGKANFYRAATGPMMTLEGTIPRIERLVTNEDDTRGLEKLREDIVKLRMPEVSKFMNVLPAGEKAFTTYYDIQRFQREKLLPAVLMSIDSLGKIDATTPLKLNFTPERTQIDPRRDSGSYNTSYTYCYNDPTQGWKCTYYENHNSWSSTKMRNEYFVDQQDLKVLKSSLMAIADQIRLGTAYSFKDSEYALRRLKAVDTLRRNSGLPGISAKDVVKLLGEFTDLLTLEPDNQLSEIAKSSSEAIRNGLELAKMKSLCNDSDRTAENSLIRPICITAEVADQLQTSLDALAGPTEVELGKNPTGKSVTIVMDISSVLKNPPKDLKALLPNSFDSSGNPVNYPNPSMGGLFPNGDLIEKLKSLSSSGHDDASRKVRDIIRHMKDHI